MQFITTGNRIAVENFTIGDLYTVTFTNGNYINSACIGIGANFVTFQRNEPELLFSLTMETAELVSTIDLYAAGTGSNNYNELQNKPSINSVELVGNKSLSALGIQPEITAESPLSSALVSGLGSAAAADTTDFATAAQGALADSAVQPADMTAALALKQDALSSAQLDAVNSGITSADVEQIETNKNNILSNTADIYSNYAKTKNKLVNNAVTTTVGEAVFTVNADKSVTVYTTGTTAEARTLPLTTTSDNVNVVVGDVFSGIPDTTYDVSIGYGIGASGNNSVIDTTTPTRAISVAGAIRYANINVRVGVNIPQANAITFKPMVCTAADWQKSKDYFPNAMSNVELTTTLQPNAYTAPTMASGITIESGGYVVIGKIVILNMRINLANSLTGAATLFTGLPIPLADSSLPVSSSVVSTSNSKGEAILITTAGYAILNTGGTLPSGVVMISAIYIKA